MATTSSRSFNQYSGIDRFRMQQQPVRGFDEGEKGTWKEGYNGSQVFTPDPNQAATPTTYREPLPSAFDRVQRPDMYGPGTARDSLLKSKYSWSLPLSERPATPVGRSWYSPERQAERVVRGTARPGQLEGARIRENLQEPPDQFEQILQDQANQNFGDTKNYGNPQNKGPLRGYLGNKQSTMGRYAVGNAMFRKPSFY